MAAHSLRHPWDSPGKNAGVGCHFLLQCMEVKSESEVAQSCPALRDPMDCSLPGSSAHGIFQARVLEWGAIAFSMRKAFLSLLAVLWNSASKWVYLSFILFLLLFFFSQLFVRPPQIPILPFYISFFFWVWSWSLPPMQWQTSIHSSSGTLSIRSSPLSLFLTSKV